MCCIRTKNNMRNTLIISNWKLNGNKNLITDTFINLTNKLMNVSRCHVVIAPPLIYLDTAKNCLLNINSCIKLCAQNVDIHLSGAFTGEISALMLQEIGVKYVLIGHSERRIHHKESDLDISKKFSISKKVGLCPILCIGENKTEHENGLAQSICIKQIDTIIKLLGVQSFKDTIIAYEPIWAIGSGITPSPKDVQLIHQSIRNHISQYDQYIANQVPIQYGGSINTNNVVQFISQKDIDGILVGSASLDTDHFLKIIQLIEDYTNKNLYRNSI